MAFRDPNDLGIVLYLKGDPTGVTYVDIEEAARDAEELTSVYTAMSAAVTTAHPNVSAAAATSMFVIIGGIIDGATITVRCRQAYSNANANYAGPPLVFFDTIWVREDTGSAAKEHTFDTNGAYLIQTASDLLGDELEFSAKTDGGDSAFVVIGCKVGS